ncbi:MAG TPA: hypothetical protein VFV50_09115 [Bdellovibrionales bacterium]|nr:hypothetical protein [Bdellovibrionales bacterium]
MKNPSDTVWNFVLVIASLLLSLIIPMPTWGLAAPKARDVAPELSRRCEETVKLSEREELGPELVRELGRLAAAARQFEMNETKADFAHLFASAHAAAALAAGAGVDGRVRYELETLRVKIASAGAVIE